MFYRSLNTSLQEKTTCKSTLFQSSGGGARGYLHALQKKATERSHKWSSKGNSWPDMARPDSWDVNISFNYSLYYLINKDDGRIVTNK